MSSRHAASIRDQVRTLRRQFLQDGDLPFSNILTEEVIAQALAALTGWLDRIFSPLVTLWVFLGQALSADHSCRAAVARLIAHRRARGQGPCSAQTGAYCQARQRLPESFFADVACSVGRSLDNQVEQRWLWHGRRVYLFDGTTVTMPDTPENQAAYPQVYNQKPGLGLPNRSASGAAARTEFPVLTDLPKSVRGIGDSVATDCPAPPPLGGAGQSVSQSVERGQEDRLISEFP